MFRRAYAKLNLALSVGPPQPAGHPAAGFHPICSWMHCIDLFDEVRVEHRHGEARGASRRPARESEIVVEWVMDAPVQMEIDWPPGQDLAVRALRVLEREAGEALPVRIQISKWIPLGGGLGGGSADAAAVLLMLDELFGLGLGIPRLVELSREIGSDVAYFLEDVEPPRPALVQGLGEEVRRLERVQGEVVLILPPFGCSTKEVYRAFDAGGAGVLRREEVEALASQERVPAEALFNDLSLPARQVRPELAELHGRLLEAIGEPVHMSGSGSTLFVVTDDPVAVAHAAGRVAPEAAVVRTRLV